MHPPMHWWEGVKRVLHCRGWDCFRQSNPTHCITTDPQPGYRLHQAPQKLWSFRKRGRHQTVQNPRQQLAPYPAFQSPGAREAVYPGEALRFPELGNLQNRKLPAQLAICPHLVLTPRTTFPSLPPSLPHSLPPSIFPLERRRGWHALLQAGNH